MAASSTGKTSSGRDRRRYTARASLGRLFEAIARRECRRRGWRILARNWRSRLGEIDILAADPQGAWALVEVRGRCGARADPPATRLDAAKRARLQRLAWSLVQRYRRPVRLWLVEVRAPAVSGWRRWAWWLTAVRFPALWGIRIRMLEIG